MFSAWESSIDGQKRERPRADEMVMRTLAIPRPAGSAPGFTLFALIATLFCVAVGICAVAFLLPHRGNSAARASTRAGALASETAEELLGAPDGAGELAAGLHSDPANPRDGIFDVRWSVTDATH